MILQAAVTMVAYWMHFVIVSPCIWNIWFYKDGMPINGSSVLKTFLLLDLYKICMLHMHGNWEPFCALYSPTHMGLEGPSVCNSMDWASTLRGDCVSSMNGKFLVNMIIGVNQNVRPLCMLLCLAFGLCLPGRETAIWFRFVHTLCCVACSLSRRLSLLSPNETSVVRIGYWTACTKVGVLLSHSMSQLSSSLIRPSKVRPDQELGLENGD